MGFKCELCGKKDAKHQVFIDKQELYVCEDCFGKTREGKNRNKPFHVVITEYIESVLSLDNNEFFERKEQDSDMILCNLIDAWGMNGRQNEFSYDADDGVYAIHSKVCLDDSEMKLRFCFVVDDGVCSGYNEVIYDFSRRKSRGYDFSVYCKLKYRSGVVEEHRFKAEQIPPEYWMLLGNVAHAMGGCDDDS